MTTVRTTRPPAVRVRLGAVYCTPLGRYCELRDVQRKPAFGEPANFTFEYVSLTDGSRFGDRFALTKHNLGLLREVAGYATAV